MQQLAGKLAGRRVGSLLRSRGALLVKALCPICHLCKGRGDNVQLKGWVQPDLRHHNGDDLGFAQK